MRRKASFLLKLIIFIIIFAAGFLFFKPEHGGGPFSAFFFLGASILGTNLAVDGGNTVELIVSFIITVGVYYLIMEIVAYILLIFGKKQ